MDSPDGRELKMNMSKSSDGETQPPDRSPNEEVDERSARLEPLEQQETKASYSYEHARSWRRWRVLQPGRGMYHDVRRRLPFY